MSVAFDSQTAGAVFTTVTPNVFSVTPVGTPAGVFVLIHSTGLAGSEDSINGTVSYGGVAMARVLYAQDAAGEFVASWIYFVGSGIPTGTQNVSIGHTGNTSEKKACCVIVTAGGDCEVVDSGKVEVSAADPSVVLSAGSDVGMGVSVFSSGLNALTSVTDLTGMTRVTTYDVANTCAVHARQTTPATGDFTIGHTSAIDDVAFCAASVREIPAAAATPPRPIVVNDATHRSFSW